MTAKIPATVQIVDRKVTVVIRTRTFSGEISVKAIDTKRGKSQLEVPGLGGVEDGQQITVEFTK